MSMPEPECPLGYPHTQLESWLGTERHAELNKWLSGQTQAICEGRSYNHEKKIYEPNECVDHPHGYVAYRWDVADWWAGKPVQDW